MERNEGVNKMVHKRVNKRVFKRINNVTKKMARYSYRGKKYIHKRECKRVNMVIKKVRYSYRNKKYAQQVPPWYVSHVLLSTDTLNGPVDNT